MKQQQFEALNRVRWQRFSDELGDVRLGYRLNPAVPRERFVADYQAMARDLAIARTRGYSRLLVAELNDLVVRGHNIVYVYRSGFKQALITFLVAGFPTQVRRHWPFMATSAVLFVAPLLAMAATVVVAPEWVYSVLTAEQASGLEAMYDPNAEHVGRERQADSDFRMFGFYIMNNISIAFQLFASGLLLGLGSVFYLLFNGIYIGAAAGHIVVVGYEQTFFSFVSGHGPFELTAIVLAGGAGLMLGYSLLAPGSRRRVDALKVTAANAVLIVMGAALMLLVAALVEAFWSSSTLIPTGVKYWVGALFWLAVFWYLFRAGRIRAHPES